MSARPTTPLTSGLRFCASCAVTLLCWTVWLGLGASFLGLGYIALEKELPVPGFVLRRAEAQFERAGLAITVGRARLDPTGKILAEDVQIRSRQFSEPLLTCRMVYVRRDIWSILAGRPLPDEIRLEGATLQLPALLSPSGTAEPLVSDLTAVVRPVGNRWTLDQFSGRLGPVIVTAYGEFAPPGRSVGGAPVAPDLLVARYLQVCRRVALELHHLDAFVDPSVAIQVEAHEGMGNTAELLFTASGADRPWGQPVTLGPLAATTSLRLEGMAARPVRLHAAVRNVNYQDEFSAENLHAIVSVEARPDGLSLLPHEALIAAGTLSVDGEDIRSPVLRVGLRHWPEVQAAAEVELNGEALSAEVDARIAEKSALVRAEGRGSHVVINRVLAKHLPRAATYFVFGDPVDFQAEARLGPDWKFATLAARVAAGRIDSHGVKITSARGRIDIEGRSFLAHDAEVTLHDNYARGSYWMDFGTSEYRMLLEGRLRPPEINGWFHGDWWPAFWNKNFAFDATPPGAEVDVRGAWRDGSRVEFFGRAEARTARVWGGDFDAVRATVFLRPNFTHAYDIDATRANGAQRVRGSFKRFTEPGTRETNRLEFNFDSTLEPATVNAILGGHATELLGSLRLTQPPKVHAEGALVGKFPAARAQFAFTGQAEGGLSYYGFPLESAKVTGSADGPDVQLTDLQFAVAGGQMSGKAALNGTPNARRLNFDVTLAHADLARSIRAVEEYESVHNGQKYVPAAENKFMKRASGGRLDATFAAEGAPGELPSFTGAGNASLTGVELGEVHLFGLLSQVLSGLSLNFSSLKFDTARSSFRMENGRLNFPDLRISGSSAVVDARGTFNFETKGLDFTAKLKPFQESKTLFTNLLGVFINPITSILELKLTGPINNPNWSIVMAQGPKPEAAAADGKPPPPAAPAAPNPSGPTGPAAPRTPPPVPKTDASTAPPPGSPSDATTASPDKKP